MTQAKAVSSLLVALLLVAACGDDDSEHDHVRPGGHQSPFPTCDLIIKTCHPLDVGDGPIHDCHDLAHGAKRDEDCVAKKDECLSRCSGDGGANDGG